MGLAIPLTNGHLAADSLNFGVGGGVAASTVGAPSTATSAADVQGTGAIMGSHNTPLHVATIFGIAGLVIIGAHYLGFRIGFDVGLGR